MSFRVRRAAVTVVGCRGAKPRQMGWVAGTKTCEGIGGAVEREV
jgi:hypothetical protein